MALGQAKILQDSDLHTRRPSSDDMLVYPGHQGSDGLQFFGSAHLAPNRKFDFRKYIKRSLEDDFKVVILVLVGTKLEIVIMEMAQQIEERTAVVKGVPVVEPSNKFFWFNRPQWILYLIHFTLFQMAFFLWVWYEFGLTSCFHHGLALSLVRVFMGVALQFLCSYITFPLYALVTQNAF
ncbi:hypothetical protein ACLOJK_038547 [Asimina triloba]